MRDSHYTPEVLFNGALSRFVRRYLTWFVIDSIVAFAAVSAAGILWRMGQPLHLGLERAFFMAMPMALIFSLVNSLRGLGKLSWRSARPAYAFDLMLSSAITTLGISGLNWFWPQGRFFPQGMVLVAGLLAFLGFFAVRYRNRLLTGLAWRWLSSRGPDKAIGERVLIIGAGDCGQLANWLLNHSRLSGYFTVTGMVDDDPSMDGMNIDGLHVFGMTRRIPELVNEKDIGVILFAIEKIHPEEQARIMGLCRRTKARIVMVPDIMQMFRDCFTWENGAFPLASQAEQAKTLPRTGMAASTAPGSDL